MEQGLTTATLFWLFVPMPLLIVWAVLSYFMEKGERK